MHNSFRSVFHFTDFFFLSHVQSVKPSIEFFISMIIFLFQEILFGLFISVLLLFIILFSFFIFLSLSYFFRYVKHAFCILFDNI